MAVSKQAAEQILIKAAPYIILLIVVLILINKAGDFLSALNPFGDDPDKKKKSQKYVDKVEDEINKKNLSQKESVYLNWANQLEGAMKGAGTNSPIVESVFKQIKTNDDLRKLIAVFGVRGDEDLIQWLRDDIPETPSFWGGTSMQDLNDILRRNGVTERL